MDLNGRLCGLVLFWGLVVGQLIQLIEKRTSGPFLWVMMASPMNDVIGLDDT